MAHLLNMFRTCRCPRCHSYDTECRGWGMKWVCWNCGYRWDEHKRQEDELDKLDREWRKRNRWREQEKSSSKRTRKGN